MDKVLFTIGVGLIVFFCCGQKQVNTEKINPDYQEYCEIPDNKIRVRVYARAMNKFTGRVYGPQFVSFVEIN